jgi:CBS domain-containing protein
MKASDIMVPDVITVGPDNSVQEVAEILLTRRISGLPVVDARGRLVGLVSEGDLLRRAESGTEHARSWWLKLLMGRETLAAEFVKEHARRVRDVMTHDVITVSPDTPVTDVASTLERNRIKRVPVVEDGRLVGIISRANLVQALAGMRRSVAADEPKSDSELRDALLSRLRSEPWAKTALVNVTVNSGAVDLWGIVDSEAEKQALRVAVEVTPSVRNVTNNVVVRPIAAMT